MKNSLEGFNSKLSRQKKASANIKTGKLKLYPEQKEKMNKGEQNLRGLKRPLSGPKYDYASLRREKGVERLFEEIMAPKIPKFDERHESTNT